MSTGVLGIACRAFKREVFGPVRSAIFRKSIFSQLPNGSFSKVWRSWDRRKGSPPLCRRPALTPATTPSCWGPRKRPALRSAKKMHLSLSIRLRLHSGLRQHGIDLSFLTPKGSRLRPILDHPHPQGRTGTLGETKNHFLRPALTESVRRGAHLRHGRYLLPRRYIQNRYQNRP
jgi:hypothetical protein